MTEGTVDEPQLGSRRIIERPRLTRLLDESSARIRMLVAPAGYGKTTLARQWLRDSPHPVAWFTAAQSSVDVAALVLGLHRAASAVYSQTGSALLERLPITANPQTDVETLADLLAEDLGSWPTKQWFVIDDYHEIANAAASERLIEILLLSRPINLLLLTRERPLWASARRILYGEIFEVGREALEMDVEEANALLGSSEGTHGVIKNSGGWPAAIALASISSSSPHELTIESDMHRFFAEELYQGIDHQVRRGLWTISLVAPEGSDAIAKLLGVKQAQSTVDVGYRQGFLSTTLTGIIEIHPLLRQFLEDKLRQEPHDVIEPLLDCAFRYLVGRKLWDKAFDVVSRFDVTHLMPDLVRASLQELLTLGRVETLRRWISRSGTAATDPAVGLAAAELAFREGHYYASEVLAKTAAESAQVDPEIQTRALISAGRAAHAASREREALAFYVRAKMGDSLPDLKRDAAMGELVATIELELPEAVNLANTLASAEELLPHERVVLAGRLLNLQVCYALPVDLDAARAAQQLIHLVDDPIARCSFRNVLGYVLAACGHYEEALALTADQLIDIERCRLEFVRPYALCVQALSHMGSRHYELAEEEIAKARQFAVRSGDTTAIAIAACLQTRLFIAQGVFRLAFAHPPRTRGLTKSLASELLASHAIARAGAGETDKALSLAVEAEQLSGASETKICVPAARAIVASYSGDSTAAAKHANDSLRTARSTGMIESFIAASRGCPELLVCLLQDKATHDDGNVILALSGDQKINGLRVEQSVLSLSPREKEVLALLGHGLSNAQIGAKLFISPRTVKVHVRHIFEKLGVKSRTAAALRAAQIGRGYAAPSASSDSSE